MSAWNYFRTCSVLKFPEKNLDLGGLETNRIHEFETWIFFHMPFCTWAKYKNCFGHLIGVCPKCYKFWGENLKKSTGKAEKLNFTIFELYIS